MDEARTLARFEHAHLNKVYRFFEANGTAYMVLEYIEGETLGALLGRVVRVSEGELLRLLEELLSGLSVVHEAGYVHRDIKPGNVMLRSGDGGAVLLDFDAARQAVGSRSQRLTTILTPGYAPLEQYDGKAGRVRPMRKSGGVRGCAFAARWVGGLGYGLGVGVVAGCEHLAGLALLSGGLGSDFGGRGDCGAVLVGEPVRVFTVGG